MNKKQIGDDTEKFVANKFISYTFLTEIHPRTHKMIFTKGKKIYVSQDNDYHNLFDIKAERYDFMIYSQVKYEIDKGNTSHAQKDIDTYYPYEFPYQKIQTWQVWKDWIKEPRRQRHKEYFYRVQERMGFLDTFWSNTDIKKGNWIEIDFDIIYGINI